ncbi:hypothetical protein CONLIGDRAFT_679374 [Coniochaeta ligniaria NRRL 30616]|uniref:Uncharacterized protein n=1 Tax=Coniochaeta ligniaria NRRL 30616 TaxID=1408157 RepID=A0A1J7JS51_9PEZI|nr:hypothetical protein CONLIGDRAFT_679374 [Coniochaeta ligniaria NRRL 30616]
MSTSALPTTPPKGVLMAPQMVPYHTTTSVHGVVRSPIFSDLNKKNFPDSNMVDPRLLNPPTNQNLNGLRPGPYVHIGTMSPESYKANLERKFGMTTEYIDELQLKWQQLKAEGVKYHRIPNPASADAGFDPLDPDYATWNNFYGDHSDAIMSEIFVKCLSDHTAFLQLMEVFLPFWRARNEKTRVPKGHPAVMQFLGYLLENNDLARSSSLFEYFEHLLQLTPHTEPVDSHNMTPQGQEVRAGLLGQIGKNNMTYVLAYKYVGQVFIAWLDTICHRGRPSPSSGALNMGGARDCINGVRDFPSFAPVESFTQRFDEYRHMLFTLADRMRVKFSREDYFVQVGHAHKVILDSVSEVTLNLNRNTLLATDFMKDPYVQILCVIWTQLGIKPETWMMHFSHSEEHIRQVAWQRSGGTLVQYVSPFAPLQYVNPADLVKVPDPPFLGTEQPEYSHWSQAQNIQGIQQPGPQQHQVAQAMIEDWSAVNYTAPKKRTPTLPTADDTVATSSSGKSKTKTTSSQGLASTKSHGQRSSAKAPQRESRPTLGTIQQGHASKATAPAHKVTAPAPGTRELPRSRMALRTRDSRRPVVPDLPKLQEADEEWEDAEFEKEMQALMRAEDPDDGEFVP